MNKEMMTGMFSVLILISLFSSSFAHAGHGEESDSNILLPFHYYEEGSYIQGTLILVFWFLIIKGLYELTMLVLARAIPQK